MKDRKKVVMSPDSYSFSVEFFLPLYTSVFYIWLKVCISNTDALEQLTVKTRALFSFPFISELCDASLVILFQGLPPESYKNYYFKKDSTRKFLPSQFRKVTHACTLILIM